PYTTLFRSEAAQGRYPIPNIREGLTMAEPTVTYGQLEDVLLSFGFQRNDLPNGHHAFQHPASIARVTLPNVSRDRTAHHFHWMSVRGTLDDFGFLPRDQF